MAYVIGMYALERLEALITSVLSYREYTSASWEGLLHEITKEMLLFPAHNQGRYESKYFKANWMLIESKSSKENSGVSDFSITNCRKYEKKYSIYLIYIF